MRIQNDPRLDRPDDLGGDLTGGDPVVDPVVQHLVDQLRNGRFDGVGFLAHQVGLDELGAEHAGPDGRARQFEFEEQALAQPDDGMLAGDVWRKAGRAVEAGVRSSAHDVAHPLLLHDGQCRSDAVDDAEHVDVEDSTPQLDRVGPGIADTGDAGVVEHHVDTTELLDGVFDQRVDLGFGGGVAHHGGDARTVLAEAGLDVAQLRRVDVGEHHAHSLGDHRLGDGEPDPAGASGDHRHVAVRDGRRARRCELRVGHRPNLGRRHHPPP